MICLSILKQVNRKAIKFVYLQTNYFVNHVNVCPNFQVQGVYGNRNSCLLRWKRPAHEAITQKATVLCRLLSVWLISNVKRAQCTFRDALRWWPAWRRWVSRQQKGLWSAWGSSASAYLCLTDIHSKRLNLSQSIQVIDCCNCCLVADHLSSYLCHRVLSWTPRTLGGSSHSRSPIFHICRLFCPLPAAHSGSSLREGWCCNYFSGPG